MTGTQRETKRRVRTAEERLLELQEKKEKLVAQEEKLKREIKEQREKDELDKMKLFYARFKSSFPVIEKLDKEDIELLAELMIEDQGERIISKVLEK